MLGRASSEIFEGVRSLFVRNGVAPYNERVGQGCECAVLLYARGRAANKVRGNLVKGGLMSGLPEADVRNQCSYATPPSCAHGFARKTGCPKFSIGGIAPCVQLIPFLNSLSGSVDMCTSQQTMPPPQYDFKKLDDVQRYCVDRLEEIECLNCNAHVPSAFGCIAAFIGFLSRLAFGNNARQGDKKYFEDFIDQYMPKYSPYKAILYGTLRCGILHALSFHDTIDDFAKQHYNGDVVKCRQDLAADDAQLERFHKMSNQLLIDHRTISNTSGVSKNAQIGKVEISAFELCHDVEDAISALFSAAKADSALKSQILTFVRIQSPIVGTHL